jgi:hypothetical protein
MSRSGNPFAEWAQFTSQASALYMESVSVICMRSMKLMGGGSSANREARQMVSEKIDANIEAAFGLPLTMPFGGAAAASAALMPYRKRVRANHRRLSRTE